MSILRRDKSNGNEIGRPDRTPIATLVGTGSRVDGTVECDGTLRVDGKITGSLQCRESVVIGETGYVEADISATVVIIAGELHGNATASEVVELMPTGKLYGNATAPSIEVSKGAFVSGRCETVPENLSPSMPMAVADHKEDDSEELFEATV
jgi:cytoskeletal protein CcmA (bactofilin family)